MYRKKPHITTLKDAPALLLLETGGAVALTTNKLRLLFNSVIILTLLPKEKNETIMNIKGNINA